MNFSKQLTQGRIKSLITNCKRINKAGYIDYPEHHSIVFIDEDKYVCCELHCLSSELYDELKSAIKRDKDMREHDVYKRIKYSTIEGIISNDRATDFFGADWGYNPASIRMLNDVYKAVNVPYRVKFRNWQMITWAELDGLRIGVSMTLVRMH